MIKLCTFKVSKPVSVSNINMTANSYGKSWPRISKAVNNANIVQSAEYNGLQFGISQAKLVHVIL